MCHCFVYCLDMWRLGDSFQKETSPSHLLVILDIETRNHYVRLDPTWGALLGATNGNFKFVKCPSGVFSKWKWTIALVEPLGMGRFPSKWWWFQDVWRHIWNVCPSYVFPGLWGWIVWCFQSAKIAAILRVPWMFQWADLWVFRWGRVFSSPKTHGPRRDQKLRNDSHDSHRLLESMISADTARSGLLFYDRCKTHKTILFVWSEEWTLTMEGCVILNRKLY